MQPFAAPSAPSAMPPVVIQDTTAASFVQDVIEASLQVPVIVDFWAPWCGPCKQLMPLLEKTVRALQGAVRLVKVNIDTEPAIAQQMRVQSVPAVFVFFQGQPIDGFMGALSEPQLKQWIDRLLRATKAAGGAQNPLAQIDEAVKQAATFLADGNWQVAQDIYSDILGIMPDQAEAYAGLVRCLLAAGEVDRAKAMHSRAPETVAKAPIFATLQAAIDLADMAQSAEPVDALRAKAVANPHDHQAQYDLAMALIAGGDRAGGVDLLLEMVRRDRKWNEEAARKQLVKLFEAFGPADPLTIAARKRLSSILFA